MKRVRLHSISSLLFVVFVVVVLSDFSSHALDGDESYIETFNGWKAIEVITEDDSRGYDWEMPGKFDGAGAFVVNSDTIGIHVNHELEDGSSISEVLLNKDRVKQSHFQHDFQQRYRWRLLRYKRPTGIRSVLRRWWGQLDR
jgi:hypothetical protein